jgi:glycosyltransferase involved in cell wall biosynthesis
MQVIYSFMIGGSEIVALNLCLNSKDRLIHSVASLEMTGPLQDHFKSHDINTFVINKQPEEIISPMLRLWRAMQIFKPDIVHTHHYYQLFYAWPGAVLAGAKIIHTEHEYYSLMNDTVCFRLRNISKFCKYVTGVNEETSIFLKNVVGIPEKKVFTIPNGIDFNKFSNSSIARSDLGLSSEDFVIAVVARLHPVKDHPTLLKAFRLLVNECPRAKLLIVGDGDERQCLNLLVKELCLVEQVKFLGVREDIPAILSCVDLVTLTSVEEGLPMCILEAMAAGKPVVATNVGGLSSVITDGENGFLIPPQDVQKLFEALIKIFDDKKTARRMGLVGKGVIESRYDLSSSIEKYVSLYSNCMRKI